MRIAGGVIAIVVGVIQTILMALATLFVSGAETLTEAAQEAGAELTEEQQAAAAELADAAGSISWIFYVLLIVSIVVVVLGIMICASKSPTNGILVAVIGIVLLVLAIISGGDILSIIWNALIVLAGVLGYMGAKQESTAVAV
jgi:hypothetical protein